MQTCLLQNEFCTFPWPSNLGWKFESTIYEDTNCLVLSSKGNSVDAFIQVWDANGKALRFLYEAQWSRLASAPAGFPPGIRVEEFDTNGTFKKWIGVSNSVSDSFADYELMSKCDNVIIYFRRASLDPDTLKIESELESFDISDPSNWVTGASLNKIIRDEQK